MGLNPTDYKTMSVLERIGPLSAGDISRYTGLATASVTDLIDRLESKGYVRRERDTADRRRVVIRPVEAKIREARRYFVSTSQSLATLYKAYSEADLELIADFLQRNARRLREETEKVEQLENVEVGQ
jgi:DNA-binding MarR family transcriptional regulator